MAQAAKVIEGEIEQPKAIAKRKLDAVPAKAMEGMGVIERLVMSGATIETIERVIAMNERQEDRQRETAYNAAMASAQAALIPVSRNQKNDQTRSKYADLAAIVSEAMPIIHRAGFGLSFSEFKSDREKHMGVACEVTHSAGHGKRYEFHIPMDAEGLRGNANKIATHAYGSTFSYGRRYATCGVFNIATRDDNDGNGNRGSPPQPTDPLITADEAKSLGEALTAGNIDHQIIFDHFKVSTLDELTASNRKAILARLEKKNSK